MHKNLPKNLSVLGFVILFPGFFFYHLLLSVGAFPAFLGGLYGPVSAFFFVAYCFVLPFYYKYLLNISPVYFLFVFSLIIFCSAWTAIYYLLMDAGYITAASLQSLKVIVTWFVMFLIGAFIPLHNGIFRKTILLSFWTMFTLVLCFVLITGDIMLYAAMDFDHGSSVEIATYQGFARSALVVSIFLMATSYKSTTFFLYIILATFILFILGARSELYSYIILAIVIFFILSMKKPKWLAFSVFVLSASLLFITLNFGVLMESRQLEVLDLSKSTSWSERLEVNRIAISQIVENPILGYFGGHIAETGSDGRYAHNALSAWVNYGIVGFSLYLLLSVSAAVVSGVKFAKGPLLSNAWSLSFFLNFIILVLILVSKSVFWVLPALGWGIYLNALRHDHTLRKL